MSGSNLKLEYIQNFGNGDTFIETGTYTGSGIRRALEHNFGVIHSIELNEELYLKALDNFKNEPRVQLWLGDSVDVIPEIVRSLTGPATFWLDAHASGPLPGGKYAPCPLLLELKSIAGEETITFENGEMKNAFVKSTNVGHTIFVDDRRLFGSAEWGFVQEPEVVGVLRFINPNYKVHLLDGHQPNDILCATVR